MGLRRRTPVPAGAVALAAVIMAGVTACSSGSRASHGGRSTSSNSHGSTNSGGGVTVEGVDASACKALAAQVGSYQGTEPSSGNLASAGELRHAPGDKWTVTGPVALDGKDQVDVVPWLKLTNPGSEPVECRSPVTAPHAGKEPYTEALLFPMEPGVRASLAKQFTVDAAPHLNANPAAPGNHVFIGRLMPGNGSLGFWTATRESLDQPQLDLDVDFLATFSYRGKAYVVVYRDPVIVADGENDPNMTGTGTVAPSADG